jgi:hypothetical protein
MTAALAVLLKEWRLLVAAAVLVLVGLQQVRVSRARADASAARAALAAERATQARAAAAAERAARTEEARRETERQEVIRHAHEQTAAADAAARDAGRAAAGLRQQIAALVAAGRRAAAHSDAPIGGAPATDALDLLADVLGRADERAGTLAAEADRRGIAGRACVAAYDALIDSGSSFAMK